MPPAFLIGPANFIAANWKPILLVLLVCGAYVKGCSDANEKHEAFVAHVEAIGKAQEAKSAQVRAAGKEITKRKDKEHAETKRQLAAALGRVGNLADSLRNRPGGSILPPIPPVAGGSEGGEGNSGVICFARDRLREGLERGLREFGERYRGLTGQGASAIAGFQTCATWALEQEAVASRSPVP